nr:uncharacterized protein LOC106614757 isoform X2 [Bactrocera oleae]
MSRITRKVLTNQKNMALLKFFVRPIACTAGNQGYIKSQNLRLRCMFKSLQEEQTQMKLKFPFNYKEAHIIDVQSRKFPFYSSR